ncbi:hypothetical protein [Microvirga mediterraneensis]|uniref:DUF1983 domain-containing protein n=1 Tax=Microvirga mediterraneensis TaxID=2754695 RepID=A0A838BNK8_9HYPH|nr:hypothetical protein [Microvirga mediterraneensis]MBA1156931.1 hypothetical protein [Microvirga mediterraneensis]
MASQDIAKLLDTQPPALPANVARVKADGLPTQHLIDWELFQTYWARTNIIATDQRIDTVKATADNASAAVTTEAQARIDGDTALAGQITTVSARANQATANGQIFFAAMAAPAGAVAAYGIFLTAGSAYTGMQLIAKSDGTAAIVFDANYFALNKSGTAQNVFTYDGSVFRFNVPVEIGTTDILAGAVNAPEAATAGTLLQVGDTGGGWRTIISVSNSGARGYVALIQGDFEYRVTPGWSGTFDGEFRILRSDGQVLYGPSALFNYVNFATVSISRLDKTFDATYTYSVQVKLNLTPTSGGAASADFRRRGIMIDLRKR